jgi:hypothetical protein
MNAKYYECHITIDPVEGETLECFKGLCTESKFKVAELFKRNGQSHNLDQFCTGHGKYFEELHDRMLHLVDRIREHGLVLRRYKIEAVLVDSRSSR